MVNSPINFDTHQAAIIKIAEEVNIVNKGGHSYTKLNAKNFNSITQIVQEIFKNKELSIKTKLDVLHRYVNIAHEFENDKSIWNIFKKSRDEKLKQVENASNIIAEASKELTTETFKELATETLNLAVEIGDAGLKKEIISFKAEIGNYLEENENDNDQIINIKTSVDQLEKEYGPLHLTSLHSSQLAILKQNFEILKDYRSAKLEIVSLEKEIQNLSKGEFNKPFTKHLELKLKQLKEKVYSFNTNFDPDKLQDKEKIELLMSDTEKIKSVINELKEINKQINSHEGISNNANISNFQKNIEQITKGEIDDETISKLILIRSYVTNFITKYRNKELLKSQLESLRNESDEFSILLTKEINRHKDDEEYQKFNTSITELNKDIEDIGSKSANLLQQILNNRIKLNQLKENFKNIKNYKKQEYQFFKLRMEIDKEFRNDPQLQPFIVNIIKIYTEIKMVYLSFKPDVALNSDQLNQIQLFSDKIDELRGNFHELKLTNKINLKNKIIDNLIAELTALKGFDSEQMIKKLKVYYTKNEISDEELTEIQKHVISTKKGFFEGLLKSINLQIKQKPYISSQTREKLTQLEEEIKQAKSIREPINNPNQTKDIENLITRLQEVSNQIEFESKVQDLQNFVWKDVEFESQLEKLVQNRHVQSDDNNKILNALNIRKTQIIDNRKILENIKDSFFKVFLEKRNSMPDEHKNEYLIVYEEIEQKYINPHEITPDFISLASNMLKVLNKFQPSQQQPPLQPPPPQPQPSHLKPKPTGAPLQQEPSAQAQKLSVAQQAPNPNLGPYSSLMEKMNTFLTKLFDNEGRSFVYAKAKPKILYFVQTSRTFNEFHSNIDLLEKNKEIDQRVAHSIKSAFNKYVKEYQLPFSVESQQLNQMDSQFYPLSVLAKSITKGFPNNIPEITLTPQEEADIDGKINQLEALEQNLMKKYGDELIRVTWHGRLSLQRIIWQDEEFLKLLSDPLMVKAILIRGKNKQEKNLGSGMNLSGALLYGLGSNRLSYLLTVAPNWAYKPTVAGVTWSKLDIMKIGTQKKEIPRKMTQEYLLEANSALNVVEKVLRELSQVNPDQAQQKVDDQMDKVNKKISQMPVSELLSTIKSLLPTQETILQFTYVKETGASTMPASMNGQCLEVMSEYDNLLAFHNGDHAAVLGYGLVSHALDARHLAAAIYGIEAGMNNSNGVPLQEAQQRLIRLLHEASNGTLGLEATALIKTRLQQIMILIVENRNKLGVEAQNWFEAQSKLQSPFRGIEHGMDIWLTKAITDYPNDYKNITKEEILELVRTSQSVEEFESHINSLQAIGKINKKSADLIKRAFKTRVASPRYFTKGNRRAGSEKDIEISIAKCSHLTLTEANLPAIFALANKHTLNKKYAVQYTTSKDYDGQWVHRPNHNGTHSARQVGCLEAMFDLIEKKGTPEAKAQLNQFTPEVKTNLKLAAYFLRAGRVDESSHDGDNPDDHYTRSAHIYGEYAEQLGVHPDLIAWTKKMIIDSCKPRNQCVEANNSLKSKFVYDLLTTVHELDLVRCFDEKHMVKLIQKTEKRLSKLVEDSGVHVVELYDHAKNLCATTGSRRRVDNHPENRQKFVQCSLHGDYCWQAIKGVPIPEWA